MKKLFENARFGDIYVCRDGKKAVYLHKRGKSSRMHYLIREGDVNAYVYLQEGHFRWGLGGSQLNVPIEERNESSLDVVDLEPKTDNLK